MKILLVADEESPYLWDYYQPGRLSGIDLILACGDLKQEYLEFLVTMGRAPLFYVPGNHDKGYINYPPEGCVSVDNRVMNYKGLRIAGLGGCMRYNLGHYQYTDQEMFRRAGKLDFKIRMAGGVDILLTHAAPRGYGDAEDNAHLGFKAFLSLMDRHHPQYLVHGHVHPRYGFQIPRSVCYGDTTVFNAVGYHIIEVEPKQSSQKKFPLFQIFSRLKKDETY